MGLLNLYMLSGTLLLLFNLAVAKISPITGPEGARGFQEVMVPRFRDSGTGWW